MPKSKTIKICYLCGPQNATHFRFPKDPLLRTLWANFCHADPTSVSVNDKLCFRHFADDAVTDKTRHGGSVFIKKGAVPTIYIGNNYQPYKNLDSDNFIDTCQTNCVSASLETSNHTFNTLPNSTDDISVLLNESSMEDINIALLNENKLRNRAGADHIDFDDSENEDYDLEVTCNYSDFEESKRNFLHFKEMLVNINKRIKREQQRSRRLRMKLKKIKIDVLEFKKNNETMDVPMHLMESSDEDVDENACINLTVFPRNNNLNNDC